MFLLAARGSGKCFRMCLGSGFFRAGRKFSFSGFPLGTRDLRRRALPTFLFPGDESYGMPDLEGRGFKIALDRHGVRVDPDTQSRIVSQEAAEEVQRYVARRFPGLRDVPIVETRVCQYENTSSGDFLIDRHPEKENVWFVGGGSGHGFKHGPAVGSMLRGGFWMGRRARRDFRWRVRTPCSGGRCIRSNFTDQGEGVDRLKLGPGVGLRLWDRPSELEGEYMRV